jgi:hypothetical protein
VTRQLPAEPRAGVAYIRGLDSFRQGNAPGNLGCETNRSAANWPERSLLGHDRSFVQTVGRQPRSMDTYEPATTVFNGSNKRRQTDSARVMKHWVIMQGSRRLDRNAALAEILVNQCSFGPA